MRQYETFMLHDFCNNTDAEAGTYNRNPAKIITEVSGYYQAKVFYSPNYAIDKEVPDESTTIVAEKKYEVR